MHTSLYFCHSNHPWAQNTWSELPSLRFIIIVTIIPMSLNNSTASNFFEHLLSCKFCKMAKLGMVWDTKSTPLGLGIIIIIIILIIHVEAPSICSTHVALNDVTLSSKPVPPLSYRHCHHLYHHHHRHHHGQGPLVIVTIICWKIPIHHTNHVTLVAMT